MEEGFEVMKASIEEIDKVRQQLWKLGMRKFKFRENVVKVSIVDKEGMKVKAMRVYREAEIEKGKEEEEEKEKMGRTKINRWENDGDDEMSELEQEEEIRSYGSYRLYD